MPIKFEKDVSTQLFKYIRVIDFKYNRTYEWHILLANTSPLCDWSAHSPVCLTGLHDTHVAFAAFDRRARSTREVLRQVQAKRYIKANPNLKIAYEVHHRADAPTTRFHFIDGSEVCIE